MADPREAHWRGNLIGASAAMFSISLGSNIANPFLPIFLHRDLGIEDLGMVALWVGVLNASAQGALAVFSFVWGITADRVGRRAMLVRGVLGSATCTALLATAQSPVHVLGIRALSGVSGGTNPGTLALVAAETPPAHLGRALGLLSAARSLGQSAGPAIGGIVSTVFPLRAIFLGGAAVQCIGVVPILFRVHETARPGPRAERPPLRGLLGEALRGPGSPLRSLLAVQAVSAFASAGSHQLLVLRLLELDAATAALVTGLAFSASSAATVLAAVVYPGVLPRLGFRGLTVAAPVVIAAMTVVTSATASLPLIIAAFAVAGLAQGAFSPAMQAMIGLETPASLKSTAFGLSSTLSTTGTATGAIAFGALAATLTPTLGLAGSAVFWLAPALLLAAWGREPAARRA